MRTPDPLVALPIGSIRLVSWAIWIKLCAHVRSFHRKMIPMDDAITLHREMAIPWHEILPPFKALIEGGLRARWAPYYSGPFQHFEHEVTRDLTWDIAPSLRLIPKVATRVLELGSGSGRLTLPLAGAQKHVVALEQSRTAASELQARLAADRNGLNVEVECTDLRDFASTRRFEAITLLGLSLHVMSLQTNAAAISLAGRHLEDGGSFCFNIFAERAHERFANSMKQDGSAIRLKHYVDRDGSARVMIKAAAFCPTTRRIVENWLVDYQDAPIESNRSIWVSSMTSWLWTLEEMVGLMERNGLRVEESFECGMGSSGDGSGAEVLFVRAIKGA
jgi:SAM-dependent methyltransferase